MFYQLVIAKHDEIEHLMDLSSNEYSIIRSKCDKLEILRKNIQLIDNVNKSLAEIRGMHDRYLKSKSSSEF